MQQITEEVVWRCFVKKLFLKILQNSVPEQNKQNTCARVSYLINTSGLELY